MDWGSVIGGGLSAAGSIASGLLGKQGSGHSYQYYLDRQFNQTRDLAKNQPLGWSKVLKRLAFIPWLFSA